MNIPYDHAIGLQNDIIIAVKNRNPNDFLKMLYENKRKGILNSNIPKNRIPEWLTDHHNIESFVIWIQNNETLPEKRISFVYNSMKPLLDYLQNNPVNDKNESSLLTSAVDLLKIKGNEYISDQCNKINNRKETDFEGSITSSRTLLETVCKFILFELDVIYEEKIDLPTLYKITSKKLNLSPDHDTEKIFKQILSGCISVIEGVGALRNSHGDAHAMNPDRKRVEKRHSDLAVSLALTMSVFLFETFESKR